MDDVDIEKAAETFVKRMENHVIGPYVFRDLGPYDDATATPEESKQFLANAKKSFNALLHDPSTDALINRYPQQ
ncbi:hypothetical protein HYZ41_00770 [archaeon]|nr:hypothetical protein [archaeon]